MCADTNKKRSKSSSASKANQVAKAKVSAKAKKAQQLEEFTEIITVLTGTNRQLKRKIFDLYTVFEISRNFNSVLDYETLLDTFIPGTRVYLSWVTFSSVHENAPFS